MPTHWALILTLLTLSGVLSELRAESSLTKARPIYHNSVNGVSFAHFTAHKHHRLSPKAVTRFGGGNSIRTERPGQCAVTCLDSASCVSFNFRTTRDTDGSFECEVLDHDIYGDTSGAFLPNERYHHYSIKVVRCDSLTYLKGKKRTFTKFLTLSPVTRCGFN